METPIKLVDEEAGVRTRDLGHQLRPALLTLLVVLAVIGLAELGLFRLTNGLLFDLAASSAAPGQPKVIVVRASESTSSAKLRARLLELGAERIVLLNVPSPTESIDVQNNTIVALSARRTPGKQIWQLPAVSLANAAADFIPAPEFGVARRLLLWLPGERGRIRTLEGGLSAISGDPADRLIVLPPTAIMPAFSENQILRANLPSGALRELTAVVAPPIARDPPRYLLSALSGSTVGAADFHGRALHAVIANRTAVEWRGTPRALLLACLTILLAALFSRLQATRRVLLTGGAIAIVICAGLLIVPLGGVLLPVTELCILVMVLAIASLVRQAEQRQHRLSLIGDRSASFLARNTLLQDQRRWIEFFPVAARLTGVQCGVVIQEQDDGSFALLASHGEVGKLAVAGLMRSRAFDHADETCPTAVSADTLSGWGHASLARLSSGGGPGIYWLFTIPADGANHPVIEAAAERLATRTSEQTALVSTLQGRQDREGAVYRSIGAVVARASELRRALGALQTAAILFDVTGIPLQANDAMERLLRVRGLQATRVTPVDVATKLGGIDADAARTMLSDLICNGGDLRIAGQADVAGQRFALRVAAADGDLLFEATDVTDLHRLSSIQTELAGEIDAKIRNDLEAVELATRLATDERLTVERRGRALAMIKEATARTRATLDSLGRLVEASLVAGQSEPYPMSPRSALVRAVAEIRPSAERSGVWLEIQQPALASLVMAQPDMLDALVLAMLEIALADSPRGSAIRAILTEEEIESVLIVSGGFGLPADQFAAMLGGESRLNSGPFRTLHRGRELLPSWGASLDTQSNVGQGYSFTLRLTRTLS